MGANLLIRYQALYHDQSRFRALVSIANPWDVQLSAGLMKNTPFEPYIAWSAKQCIIKSVNSECYDQIRKKYGIDVIKIADASRWNQLDRLYTSKCHTHYLPEMSEEQLQKIAKEGYKQRESVSTNICEYLNNGSSLNLIPLIKIPTLVVHAKDDSIIPVDCVPLSLCKKNPNMLILLTQRGSHCLYLQGVLFPQENNRWFPKASKSFIDSVDSTLKDMDRQNVNQFTFGS